MIKYTIQKAIQVFGIILMPICAMGAYDDGSWFGIFCCIGVFILLLQELISRDLEKKLHGEL